MPRISSGLHGVAALPALARAWSRSGSFRALWVSAASLCTTSAGVPAGAARPSQERTSKPGSTAEAGGTSGRVGQARALVTARARSRPDLMCGMATVSVSLSTSTSPAITACTGAPPPR